MERVVKVAWVDGGRVFGFGRIADGGIATVRIEAVVVEERRKKAERKRLENIGKCMMNFEERVPVRVYGPGFVRTLASR